MKLRLLLAPVASLVLIAACSVYLNGVGSTDVQAAPAPAMIANAGSYGAGAARSAGLPARRRAHRAFLARGRDQVAARRVLMQRTRQLIISSHRAAARIAQLQKAALKAPERRYLQKVAQARVGARSTLRAPLPDSLVAASA